MAVVLMLGSVATKPLNNLMLFFVNVKTSVRPLHCRQCSEVSPVHSCMLHHSVSTVLYYVVELCTHYMCAVIDPPVVSNNRIPCPLF